MAKTAVKKFELILRGEVPHWISASVFKVIYELAEEAVAAAGIASITDGVGGCGSIRPSTEKRILKCKSLSSYSVGLKPGGQVNSNVTQVVVVGENPRDDVCSVFISMPPHHSEMFRAFLRLQPNETYRRKEEVKKKVVMESLPLPPPPSTSFFDNETLALYLHSIHEAGDTISENTAYSLASQLTGDTLIYQAARKIGLIDGKDLLCWITQDGHELIHQEICPPAPAVEPKQMETSEFIFLRTAVRVARERCAGLEAEHDRFTKVKSDLQKQIGALTGDQKSLDKTVASLTDQINLLSSKLADANRQQTQNRSKILLLEGQRRELPSDESLDAARRELEAAEKAYKKFVEI